MLASLIRNFVKKIFRPVFRPLFHRIRLIVREEIVSAQAEKNLLEADREKESRIRSTIREELINAQTNQKKELSDKDCEKESRIRSIIREELINAQASQKKPVQENLKKEKPLFRHTTEVPYDSASSDNLHPKNIVLVAMDYLLERCSNRRLVIYGIGSETLKMSKLLSTYNIHVNYYIDDENASDKIFEGKIVRHSLDIAYEDFSKIFIIVANERESYGIARNKLIQLGLIEDIDFTYYKNVPIYEVNYYYDVTLSYNRVRDKLEGFELFGDINNPKALKIVALGGSTTESTHCFVKCWAQYLADKFIDNGTSVIVYCGGIAGYTSSQEMLKMVRDVLPLNPDIVLSYSGYNDWRENTQIPCRKEKEGRPFITNFQIDYINSVLSQYPEENRIVYYGLKNNKTASDLWMDNMRIMHAVADEYHILFLSFLQPFFGIGKYKFTDSQKTIFNRWKINYPNPEIPEDKKRIDLIVNNANQLINEIKGFDYITDLTDIFADCTGVYYDICHVNEEGNQIIANHIYQKLIRSLSNWKTK